MTSGWSGPRLLRPDDGRFASWCRSYAGARRSRRTTRAGQQCLAARDQRMALSWPLPDSRKKCCSNTRSQRSWPRPSFYRARRGTPSRRAGRSCWILIGLNSITCADRAQSGALNTTHIGGPAFDLAEALLLARRQRSLPRRPSARRAQRKNCELLTAFLASCGRPELP